MARPVKCPGCGMFFDRDKIEYAHIKNRYWHKLCHERELDKISQEDKDLKLLEEAIIRILKIDYINARVRKQMKDMKAAYNFTYTGMEKSLTYFYEVKGNSIEKANGGIGIIPYVYEDAKKYYFTIFMASLQNEGKDVEKYVKKGIAIHIHPPKRDVKPIKLIDMDMITEEAQLDGE